MVLFLHGWGSTSSFFREIVPLFTDQGFRAILFDAEGQGKSEKGAPTGHLEFYRTHYRNSIVRDVFQLLKIRGVEGRFGIVGHSLIGGGIAQLIALENPQLVDFLILLNTGPLIIDNPVANIFWNVLPKNVRMNYDEIFRTEGLLDEIIEKTFPFIRMAIMDEIKKARKSDEKLRFPPHQELRALIFENIRALFDAPLPSSKITCPTLVVGCELDNFAPVQMARELAELIPNATYREIDMAGHFGPSQRWEELGTFVDEFFRDLVPSG